MFRRILQSGGRHGAYSSSVKSFKFNVVALGVASSVTLSAGLYSRDQRTQCDVMQTIPIALPNVTPTVINVSTAIAPTESFLQSVIRSVKKTTCEVAKGAVKTVRYAQRILLYTLYGIPLTGLLPANYMLGSSVPAVEEFTWDYIMWSIQRLGPCFVKLAKWASTRPDLFPPRLVERLVKLQDDVAVNHPRDTIHKTLSVAFGENWQEVLELDPLPLGAGSVAQVFKGTLKKSMKTAVDPIEGDTGVNMYGFKNRKAPEIVPSGRQVAIKMIHPHVEQLVRTDMELLSLFANFMDRFPSLEILSLGETCRQFADIMNKQLDLRVEANNLIKFTQKFASDKWAAFPAPIETLISHNVMVETLMEGKPINYFMDLKSEVGDSVHSLKMKLSDLGCRLILKMVFFDNFVHGDLHPGEHFISCFILYFMNVWSFAVLSAYLTLRLSFSRLHATLIIFCHSLSFQRQFAGGLFAQWRAPPVGAGLWHHLQCERREGIPEPRQRVHLLHEARRARGGSLHDRTHLLRDRAACG